MFLVFYSILCFCSFVVFLLNTLCQLPKKLHLVFDSEELDFGWDEHFALWFLVPLVCFALCAFGAPHYALLVNLFDCTVQALYIYIYVW